MAKKRRLPPARSVAQRNPECVASAAGYSRTQRIVINAFVIFHIVALTCWALPVANPLMVWCKNEVRPYLVWAGLFQFWDMFSPSPKTVNTYLEAIILYEDGNTRGWRFRRMEQLSFTDRYVKERYRKFAEVLNSDTYAALRPDAARWIARQNAGPVPIKMILLVRYWADIVPPSNGSPPPVPYDSHIFYSYAMQPGDLK
jgi:hypothetical protein